MDDVHSLWECPSAWSWIPTPRPPKLRTQWPALVPPPPVLKSFWVQWDNMSDMSWDDTSIDVSFGNLIPMLPKAACLWGPFCLEWRNATLPRNPISTKRISKNWTSPELFIFFHHLSIQLCILDIIWHRFFNRCKLSPRLPWLPSRTGTWAISRCPRQKSLGASDHWLGSWCFQAVPNSSPTSYSYFSTNVKIHK